MRIVVLLIGLVITALAGRGWAQFVDEAQKCFDPAPRPPEMTIRFCTSAIESKRTSEVGRSAAFANRGHAYHARGQLDQAIQDYTQSLRLGPDSGRVRFSRGVAYLKKGQNEPAIEDLTEALRVTPNDALAHYYRGVAEWQRGQVDAALRDYEEALRLDPRLASGYAARGDVYRVRADRGRAIQDYDQAIRLNPKERNAYVGRGLIRFDQGELAESIPDFARATELDPDAIGPALYLYLAREHLRQDGRPALAPLARGDLSRWPGPIVSMYLGRLKPKDVVAALPSGNSTAQRTQRCQGYFYVGHELLLRGQTFDGVQMLRDAVTTAVSGLDEYESARAYLARLPK